MRPVNLLPERNRPRTPTGGQKGSAYFVLGGLVLVLIAAVVYVVTLNSINSSKDKIAAANAQAQHDNALANQLTPYGDFQKIKQQRVASVMQLAASRFDWERLVRELSFVLPDGVWLTNVAASHAGPASASGSSTPTSSPQHQQQASGAPSLLVDGCAANQAQVAVALVRLRELQGASDVQLTSSAKPSVSGGSSSSASNNTSGCGTTGGQPNYSFEANVTFTQQPGNTAAPRRLGGGA